MIGWIGNAFFLVSGLALCRKRRWGFLAAAGGNAAYMIQSAGMSNWSLLVLSTSLLIMDFKIYATWR